MANKKNRMGSDPLAWIQKTTPIELNNMESSSNLDLLSKQSNLSLQNHFSNSENTSNLQTTSQDNALVNHNNDINYKKTSQAGLNPGWSRATFILPEEQLEKIKALAYFQRRNIKEVVEEIFITFFDNNQPEVNEALNLYRKKKK
jgi:hypothetical protein